MKERICTYIICTNGGGGARLDAPNSNRDLSHDIIRFFPKTRDRVFKVCAPLYESGCSLREIEEKTGFPKTTIREVLNRCGLVLRKRSKRPIKDDKLSTKLRSPVLPYGYAWLEGKLVMDPREYKVVIKIMDLWRSGRGLTAIAVYLNDQKILTRMDKKWFHGTVGAIVKRESNKK